MTELEIDAFLEIVKAGNISRASEQMYITQPALSRRIKILEEELGYPLFIRQRGSRELYLTGEGVRFVEVAKRWKELWNDVRMIREQSDTPTLRISAVNSVCNNILPSTFAVSSIVSCPPSCIAPGAKFSACPPICTIATSNDTRVRVDFCSKIIPSDL